MFLFSLHLKDCIQFCCTCTMTIKTFNSIQSCWSVISDNRPSNNIFSFFNSHPNRHTADVIKHLGRWNQNAGVAWALIKVQCLGRTWQWSVGESACPQVKLLPVLQVTCCNSADWVKTQPEQTPFKHPTVWGFLLLWPTVHTRPAVLAENSRNRPSSPLTVGYCRKWTQQWGRQNSEWF